MTAKAEFNAEEWSLVLEGPPIAAMRVISASRGGTIRESLEMGKAYTEERENHGSSELLDAIVGDRPALDPKDYSSPEELGTVGMARLRGAVETVASKGTSIEVDEYKAFVYSLSERVARAHKEGGFLGIGGKEISEDERAALEQIASALEYTPPAPESLDPQS